MPAGDSRSPETAINSGPRRLKTKKKKARANFTFSADEAGSRFECNVDGKGFSGCSSPLKLKLKAGRHVLDVRAIDLAGNVDSSPASRAIRVKRKKKGGDR